MGDKWLTRARLSLAFVSAAALIYGLSWFVAGVVRQGQKYHDAAAYWLLPTNLTSFYFLPLFALAVGMLSWAAGRHTRWNAIAVVAALVFTITRVIFWSHVADSMGPYSGPRELAAAQDGRPISSLAIGSIGMFSWVSLALGIRDALSKNAPADSPRTLRPSGAG